MTPGDLDTIDRPAQSTPRRRLFRWRQNGAHELAPRTLQPCIGLYAAVRQLAAGKPTRAALAWSVASPLTPYPDVERELTHCSSTIVFSRNPPSGSLGEACTLFRHVNGLSPIRTRAEAATSPARTLALRRVLLHDVLHVLLDFPADWPGQMGVSSFLAAQRYCPQFEHAARALGQVYMTAAPWSREDLGDAEYRGRQLALSAPRLLLQPLEQDWETSLIKLQVRANLKPVKTLGAIGPGSRAGGARRTEASHNL